MILKGSQRSGGQNLATHLMRVDDNEHVRIHQVRGFASENLHGAFKEAEAISRGTKCSQYLFSLSLNPPEGQSVSEADFEAAVERIEASLGYQDQPRAIVFHEKEGRRHAHCVWSRIDADTMTARPLPFFKRKLMDISRELYLEHGWKMPHGLTNAAERDPRNFTLAEWQQAKRQGIDPRWLKSTIQSCWAGSDNTQSFSASLNAHGFALAKGDRRSHVVVDHSGEVYALPRMLGLKTKEVRARLGDGADLPDVASIKAKIGEKMVPALRRHIEESRTQFRERSAKLGQYKAQMTQAHRDAREKLDERHKSEWDDRTRERAARLPKGVRGLWHRITGKYQQVRRQNEDEARAQRDRQSLERRDLIEGQLEQRQVLQEKYRDLRSRQAEQLLDLRRDVGRFLKLSESPSLGQRQSQGLGLRLER